jgi:hypothetical protein
MLKTAKPLVYICCILLFMLISGFLLKTYLKSDPYLADVEKFVLKNTSVVDKYGTISTITFTKLTKVGATENKKAYRIYTFFIDGKEDSGVIEVIASNLNPADGKGTYKFRWD